VSAPRQTRGFQALLRGRQSPGVAAFQSQHARQFRPVQVQYAHDQQHSSRQPERLVERFLDLVYLR
jgi:hypothetical protein